MDRRLVDATAPKEKVVRKAGLDYFTTGENHDYLADEVLLLESGEAQRALQAGDELFEILRETARRSLQDEHRLKLLGIPERCRPLLEWSVRNEWDDYLFGRFDFGGGIDGTPLKLIEFNADTSSLLPETATLQPEVLKRTGIKRPAPNKLAEELKATFGRIGAARKGTVGLFAHLGYPEDRINSELLELASLEARWKKTAVNELPEIVFDPEAGMLLEDKSGELVRYYYLIKYFPWDWVALEEPDLWDMLEDMITNNYVRVLNPVWSMLLQSKALMAFAYQDNPGHPLLLPTVFDPTELPTPRAGYVRKPVFGRTGENIMVSLDGRRADAENKGDYGDLPVIYQQFTNFATDSDNYRYQLSTFVTPRASAVCCRRQEGLIMDDDAEFVSLGLLT